ncbi:MAG TPA: hypothetical protein P5572_09235 [Phycisphaerae bacterium]|nr:hypothetical protein [Phycisphaerae bacterium]
MRAESKRWVAIGGTALVIVGAGTYMARATLFPPQDAADKLLAEMKNSPEDQRFENMRAMREKAGQLSDEERDKLREGMHAMFQEEMDARITAYENASDEEKVALLDKQIDEMVARRAEWEKRRAEREAERAKAGQGGGQGNGGQPGAGPGAGGPPADGNAARGEGRGPGRRGPQSVQERKQREESRNADNDVRRIRYFRALRERAQKRGVDMGRGPWGGGGGPGGRGGPGGGRGR